MYLGCAILPGKSNLCLLKVFPPFYLFIFLRKKEKKLITMPVWNRPVGEIETVESSTLILQSQIISRVP